MGKNHLQVITVQFDLNETGKKTKTVSFKVAHNMPETFGLSFEGALDNWLFRTKKYTAKSLCDYVNSKNTGFICEPYDIERHGAIIE